MILEDHLDGCSGPKVGDPDLGAIAFDDLRDGASIVVFWYDSNASPVECHKMSEVVKVNDKRFLPM